MPSLAAHLGVRAPRQTRGDASRPPEASSGATVSLPSGLGETRVPRVPRPAEDGSLPETDEVSGVPRRGSGVIPRVVSRRGSLVARRNSTLASVAERLAEESRDVPDAAFDVPELAVPDPPTTHAPQLMGKPRERLYRHPDGTLSQTRPPRNPYAVASRKDWADLVQYARLNDGDEECTSTGVSFRYGVGVTWPEHATYLKKIGLEPETNPDGSHVAYDAGKVNPLNDPDHPFHAYKKNHDAFNKRREKNEKRNDAKREEDAARDEEVDVWEANDLVDDVRFTNSNPPPPRMPWLDEKQRAFVYERVLESRRRYNERGGMEPIGPMTA